MYMKFNDDSTILSQKINLNMSVGNLYLGCSSVLVERTSTNANSLIDMKSREILLFKTLTSNQHLAGKIISVEAFTSEFSICLK